MRDLLTVLERPEMLDLVEHMVRGIITGDVQQTSPGDKWTSALTPLLAAIHGPDRPGEALQAVLDDNLKALEELPDSCLAGDLTVLEDYRPGLALAEWIDRLLGSQLAKDLRIEKRALVVALGMLQQNDDDAWPLVITGRLGSAMALGRSFHAFTAAQSNFVLRGMAILLCAAASRVRAALLRRWGRIPMTEAYRSECEWQFQARTMMTAIITPAVQSSRLIAVAGKRATAGLDPFEGSFLEESAIMKRAERLMRSAHQQSHRRTFADALTQVAACAVGQMNELAAITRQQLQDEGLGRRTFVEARLGARASHCSVIIGVALLAAPSRVESCIASISAGQSPPSPTPLDFAAAFEPGKFPGGGATLRTVQSIRAEVQTDKEASALGTRNADDKSGSAMMKAALKQFSQSYPAGAVETLAIDPMMWFAR